MRVNAYCVKAYAYDFNVDKLYNSSDMGESFVHSEDFGMCVPGFRHAWRLSFSGFANDNSLPPLVLAFTFHKITIHCTETTGVSVPVR